MWTAKDARRSRPYTCTMLDMVEQGAVDKDTLITDLLGYLSEDEVKDFARRNDYIPNDPDEDEVTDEEYDDDERDE